MANLPPITHITKNGTPVSVIEKKRNAALDASRLKKSKTAERRVHQKPIQRKITPKAAPKEVIPQVPEKDMATPNPMQKKHSFVNEPEPVKAKGFFGKLLHKPQQPAPKQSKKKLEKEKLSPMARRIYFAIVNAFSDEEAQKQSLGLFGDRLSDENNEAVIILEGLPFKIIDVAGPDSVDTNFIHLVIITLGALDNASAPTQITLKTFIEKLSSTKDLSEAVPVEPTPAEPTITIIDEITPAEVPVEQIIEQAPEPTVVVVAEKPIEIENELLTPKELLTMVSNILRHAIKQSEYNELVAPFYKENVTNEEIQILLADTRTQNATFVVYGPHQLVQTLLALGLPEQEVEELIQDAENRRNEWGIIHPEYSLRFNHTTQGPRLYSLNIIEKSTNNA